MNVKLGQLQEAHRQPFRSATQPHSHTAAAQRVKGPETQRLNLLCCSVYDDVKAKGGPLTLHICNNLLSATFDQLTGESTSWSAEQLAQQGEAVMRDMVEAGISPSATPSAFHRTNPPTHRTTLIATSIRWLDHTTTPCRSLQQSSMSGGLAGLAMMLTLTAQLLQRNRRTRT